MADIGVLNCIEIVATGKNRSRKYQLPLSEIDTNLPKSGGFSFSTAAASAIKQIRQPMMLREPCTYRTEWLASYAPNQSFYLPEALRNQLMLQG